MPLENCRLLFISELFDIEKPGTQLTKKDLMLDPSASPAKRKIFAFFFFSSKLSSIEIMGLKWLEIFILRHDRCNWFLFGNAF